MWPWVNECVSNWERGVVVSDGAVPVTNLMTLLEDIDLDHVSTANFSARYILWQ